MRQLQAPNLDVAQRRRRFRGLKAARFGREGLPKKRKEKKNTKKTGALSRKKGLQDGGLCLGFGRTGSLEVLVSFCFFFGSPFECRRLQPKGGRGFRVYQARGAGRCGCVRAPTAPNLARRFEGLPGPCQAFWGRLPPIPRHFSTLAMNMFRHLIPSNEPRGSLWEVSSGKMGDCPGSGQRRSTFEQNKLLASCTVVGGGARATGCLNKPSPTEPCLVALERGQPQERVSGPATSNQSPRFVQWVSTGMLFQESKHGRIGAWLVAESPCPQRAGGGGGGGGAGGLFLQARPHGSVAQKSPSQGRN